VCSLHQVNPRVATGRAAVDRRSSAGATRAPVRSQGGFAGPPIPDSSRLRILRYEDGKWHEQDDVSTENLPPIRPGGLLWFDFRGVQDHAAVRAIGIHLQLHPLALADIVNVGQRPKMEEYEEDELFMVARVTVREAADQSRDTDSPTAPGPGWRWEQLALFIGEGFVASFQELDGDCFERVRRRLQHSAFAHPQVTEAGGLAAVILDAVVDNYFPLLEHLSDQLEAIEDRVVEKPERAILSEIYEVKRELLNFRRAAWPLRDVLNELARISHPLMPESAKPFLRDTADHAVQVVDVLESYRELAASFIDVYLSSISYETNEVMRVLTIIATIFIPLTFLAGVYGMNFDVLPELHWNWGYLLFWIMCLGVTTAMLAIFWRLGWMGRKRH
jgi:magnesium transporter